MQHYGKTFGEKCYIAVTGTVWVAGLLIAGSENSFMPWVNGIGLVLFLISSVLLGKFFRQLEPAGNLVIFSKLYSQQNLRCEQRVKKNCTVCCRYAPNIR